MCPGATTPRRMRERLMESAPAQLAGGLMVYVRRGMLVRDRAGRDAGVVAAISVASARSNAAALVVWTCSAPPCYRVIAVAHIAGVTGEVVYLSLGRTSVRRLPVRRAP